MAEVGTVYVSVMPQGKDFTKSMEGLGQEAGAKSGKNISKGIGGVLKSSAKDIGGSLSEGLTRASGIAGKAVVGMGKVAAGALSGIVAGAVAAKGAVAAIGAGALASYSDFEQLEGGINAIFSAMDTSRIFADAQGAFRDLNLSANEYMSMVAGVGATFKATMGDQKGYDTARRGMLAISDYASGTGKDVGMLMEKYQMISRSASGYLSIADQFSGILPQTTDGFLEQAKAAGLLTKDYKSLTEVPVDEYQMALTGLLEQGVDNLGLAGNTARETEKTISGSLAATKASWSNFVTSLGSGQGVTEAFKNVITSAGDLAKNVVPVMGTIGTTIRDSWPEIARMAVEGIETDLVPAIDTALGNNLASRIWAKIQELGTSLSTAWEGIRTAAQPVLDTLGPLFEDAFGALTTVIIPGIQQLSEEILPPFGEALQTLADSGALTTIATALTDFATTALPPIVEFMSILATTLLPPLADALANVAPVLGGMVGPLLLIGGGLALWNGFLGPVVGFFTSFVAALTSAAPAAAAAAPAIGAAGTSAGAAGAAAAPAAASIAAIGAAALGIGAGIAAACAGISLLVDAAIRLGSAGPQAQMAMVGLGVGIVALAGAFALLGPALTAGALGIGTFGAAVLAIGAGVLAAGQGINLMGDGISKLASAMPSFNAEALAFAGSLTAIAIPLGAVAVPAAAAGAAFVALGAGLLTTGAGLALVGGSLMVTAMGLTMATMPATNFTTAVTQMGAAMTGAAAPLATFQAGAAALAAAATPLALAFASMAQTVQMTGVGLMLVATGATSGASSMTMLSTGMQGVGSSAPAVSSGIQQMSAAAKVVGTVFAAAAAMCHMLAQGLVQVRQTSMQAGATLNAARTAANGLSLAGTAAASSAAQASGKLRAMGTDATSAASGMVKAAGSSVNALNQIRSAAANAASAVHSIGSKSVTIPIQFGHLKMPHLSVSGRMDLEKGTVPTVNVSWYARGGVFDSPSIIGVGDASTPEVVAPQSMIYETALDAVNDGGERVVAAIDRLERHIGPIIARFAPRDGERDFDRRVREAVNRGRSN